MNVLEEIIRSKHQQVQQEVLQTPVKELETYPAFERSCYSLINSLNDFNSSGIIAEFKRRSPSKGIINDKVSVSEVTGAYYKYGAAGLSVLTDTDFFGGSIKDIGEARSNPLPILRKDFIISEYQVIQSKAIGADVILLIAAALEVSEVKIFANLAMQLGMEVLLEVHNEEELAHIAEGISLVGVNNRDLKSFTVDVKRSVDLAPAILKRMQMVSGKQGLLISESGISNVKTVSMLKQAGYSGFLMGEHFMKQKNPGIAFSSFVQELKTSDQQSICK